ncbi:MAG: ATP-dependent Clp protease ATP-binding subunit [bacterium]
MESNKPNILNKFTTHLKKTLEQASGLGFELRHAFVNPEHILYGLSESRGGIAAEILSKAGVDSEKLKTFIISRNEPLTEDISFIPDQLKLSLPSKKALEKAGLVANEYAHKYVGTEHLLFGLLELNDPTLERYFSEQQIKVKEVRQHLIVVLKSTTKFPDLTGFFDVSKDSEVIEEGFISDKGGKNPALDFFTSDLTEPSLQKTIDPVIGRIKEIDRVMHILSRRTKNNPVLIGDPGVGKTAIVEGLAKNITEGNVPDALRNKRLLNLDMSLLVAGTMYRGEFESRLRQVIEEIKSDPNIILFIDELHTIVGTGSASGSMDAANILKPALAKGQIRCIGATTIDEYRKHIEADAALERRFQPIMVEEPSPEETLTILKGIKQNYEQFHRVSISDDALDSAVQLSVRYIQDKFLPDKAIDLLDEASSKRKINRKKSPLVKQYEQIEEIISELVSQKQAAVKEENFDRAITIKQQEMLARRKQQKIREKMLKEEQRFEGTITDQDIADVVARTTGIPVEDLLKEEKQKLLKLEQSLNSQIIGQNEAIEKIANFIRRSRVGLSHPNKPIASFIFLGPSGVGKTETAKKIAETIFENSKSLIRIDMSEFSESFTSSKLIGAPAGYVGYKDQNSLTDLVKRKPYSVILLDEIEKAHPDIFNIFLQVLDEGQLTDGGGRTVNFKNTLIIMTSNVGVAELNNTARMGFSAPDDYADSNLETEYQRVKEQVLKDLEKKFRPEFLNRLDEIIVFRPLTQSDVIKIVRLQIAELQERLKDQEIAISVTPAAEKLIAKQGFKPEYGARAVRRVIQSSIENPLAGKLLDNANNQGRKIVVDAEQDKVILK